MIEFNDIVILHSDTEVVHPSLKIGTDFLVPVVHGDAPTATSKTTQFGFKACEGFLRDSKPFTCEGKTEERTFLSLHHLAFVPVDLHLEDFLKETADTLHHAISGPFGLHEDDKIIGISCELMPPFLQFLIEIIQKDITQKRRKRPALRNSFGRCIEPAVYDNTGPKVLADQTENAFVSDSPGRPGSSERRD